MRVLHYTLGLPPYRTGGLTKYSIDLMRQQLNEGYSVYCLFPGEFSLMTKETKIKWYKDFYGVKTYEVINPLPVSIFGGIKQTELFYRSINDICFEEFLINNSINIVHLHTIMGLPVEFLNVCKKLNVKVVYTTHDYFGLCMRVNFINSNNELCTNRDLRRCAYCNKNGDDYFKLRFLQSGIYRLMKNKGIINQIKKIKKTKLNTGPRLECHKNHNLNLNDIDINEYRRLYDYYDKIFQSIDYFLYNSTVAQNMFRKFVNEPSGSLVSITHGDIKDNRTIKDYVSDTLNVTYLGPYKKYKGFYLLMKTMKELYRDGIDNIHLTVYGDIWIEDQLTNVTFNKSYSYEQLREIFNHTDVLVVPSIWKETFGFIVLEALSYGVPVLVSDDVGAKDLLMSSKKPAGIVFNPSVEELKTILFNLLQNKTLLKEFNQNIMTNQYKFLISNHNKEVMAIYKELVK